MVNTPSTLPNACMICGKQRVVVSVTKELIGKSVVINTETACPDSDCQKKLLKQLENERVKRENAKTPFIRTFGNPTRVQLTRTKTA